MIILIQTPNTLSPPPHDPGHADLAPSLPTTDVCSNYVKNILRTIKILGWVVDF